MKWIPLISSEQLDLIKEKSTLTPQVIFKHSTRCSISSMALNRLERELAPENADFYFLDLIQHRQLSNAVAEVFEVHHESPQILLIKNSECVYDESHQGINMQELCEQLSSN
ncbi:MAG: bacillithiol system redox-active protein YtxJ [Sphingobacteriia bacterium]|jgi:bacillithiol system protein YtxJ